MAKVMIGLLQKEIEDAVKEYVLDRVQSGYNFEFGDLDVDFTHATDGRVVCDVTATLSDRVTEA